MTTSDAQERARASRKDAGGARRAELIAAAAECFDDLGYTAVTVEQIAERAGTSRPTFYAYFSSKDDVLFALLDVVADAIEASQLIDDIDDLEPKEVIAATMRAYADAVLSYGNLVALLDSLAAVREDVAQRWDRVNRRTARRYANYLASLPTDSVDPCVAPERLVQMLNDSIHQGAKRISRRSEADREQFIADFIRVTERLIGL